MELMLVINCPPNWEGILDPPGDSNVISRVLQGEAEHQCQTDAVWGRFNWPFLALRLVGSCKLRDGGTLEWGTGKKTVSPLEPQERNAALLIPDLTQ